MRRRDPRLDVTLIDAVLVLAVVVTVPLAMRLAGFDDHTYLVVAAGSAAAASVFVNGYVAVALVLVWLAAVAYLTVRSLVPLPQTFGEAFRALPFAYLVVGAGWLLMARLGVRPLGFGDVIVSLTAVHFHYAGFIAPVLVMQLPAAGLSTSVATVGVMAATPLTAAGISLHPALGVLGAATFVVALGIYSWHVLGHVAAAQTGMARVLLVVSAVSIGAGVVLGAIYALGQWLGTPAPGIETMTRSHGMLNALGFSLCGVLGWREAENTSPETTILVD